MEISYPVLVLRRSHSESFHVQHYCERDLMCINCASAAPREIVDHAIKPSVEWCVEIAPRFIGEFGRIEQGSKLPYSWVLVHVDFVSVAHKSTLV